MASTVGCTESTRALAALVSLATSDGPMSLRQVAGAADAKARALSRTLGHLRGAGLVSRAPGPRGGYELARPAFLISVADVLRACRREPEAPSSPHLEALRPMARLLDGTSVADLAGIPAPRRFPFRAVGVARSENASPQLP